MDQLRQVMLRQEEKKEKLFSKHKDEKATVFTALAYFDSSYKLSLALIPVINC